MGESRPAGCLSERAVRLSDTFLPGSGLGSGGLASEDTALPGLWGDLPSCLIGQNETESHAQVWPSPASGRGCLDWGDGNVESQPPRPPQRSVHQAHKHCWVPIPGRPCWDWGSERTQTWSLPWRTHLWVLERSLQMGSGWERVRPEEGVIITLREG